MLFGKNGIEVALALESRSTRPSSAVFDNSGGDGFKLRGNLRP
eukprot:CAMPEP_0180651848 /NCGR_PEP_ID=MMETSP1037_2-20121125/53142_1 /TAXON_ID=632150 /ORGANISM="Azadinium spinosum, Strain 3D9" /LENGTH=42 /DNA_ID= /DNA_START= /DNA_END= /DNA_ORIENTATION=